MGATIRRVAACPRLLLLGGLVTLALGLGGCGPEADRSQGGGAGGDVRNRDAVVELHGSKPGDERIYYQTPRRPPVVGPSET